MQDLIVAIGLVFVIEGLMLALAPRLVEQALTIMAEMPPGARRTVGLAAIAVGVLVVWLART